VSWDRPFVLVLLESSAVLAFASLLDASSCCAGDDEDDDDVLEEFLLALLLLFLLLIESQRLMFKLEVALEGIKRSEVPRSDAVDPLCFRRIGVEEAALLWPKLLWKLVDSLDSEKLYFRGDAELWIELYPIIDCGCISGVTAGTGRNIEESQSLVMPGGGTRPEEEDIMEEEEGAGPRGGQPEVVAI
jgi:hypothetical protein